MNKQDKNINQGEENIAFVDLNQISLGDILKNKRQEMKMEIKDVSIYLRTRASNITAIENNNIDKVAKNIYAFGLVISYSKLLGIDQNLVQNKMKSINIKSNVENKNHLLINLNEEKNLSPTKDSFINFFLISFISFLILLSIYHSREDKSSLITTEKITSELRLIQNTKNNFNN